MGKFDEPLKSNSELPALTDDDFPPGSTKEKPKKKSNSEPPATELPIPVGESAFSLVERDLPDPVRLCDPWAVEGINIIAGRPKLGKTTLERQKLAAAATGSQFLDSSFVTPVSCAFLSLEEGELLCRSKLKMAGFSDGALGAIQLFFEWPRGAVGTDLLDRYLDTHPDVRFVCIDSLTRFRVVPDARLHAFMCDYEAVNMLHDMSKRHPGVVVDVVHHTRKAKSDDPIDDISGTYGLTAAADSYVVMRHLSSGLSGMSGLSGVTLHAGGRLWTRDDNEYQLKRAGQHRWEMVGVNLNIPDEQVETLRHVRDAPFGMSGITLGQKLNISRQSAWERLDILVEKGVAFKRMGKVYAK